MGKWKILSPAIWNTLSSSLRNLVETVNANASSVAGLGEDFAALSRLTAEQVAGKQDKLSAVSVTIPASGWGSDSTTTYPKYYNITASGVTASDRVNVSLEPAALSTAAACGLCPACETLDGKIRIRAVSVPSASMAAHYWVEKGA